MAQDIRELLKRDTKPGTSTMPDGHQARFIKKLDHQLPQKNKPYFLWLQIAAVLLLFMALGFGGYHFLKTPQPQNVPELVNTTPVANPENKSLGDVSPELKKVEEYYLASINFELSRVSYTAETKEILDGYLEQINELTLEYKRLSDELTASGPNELLVNALIDNLKFRLNLLYKLREHLNELQTAENTNTFHQQTT